jgi:hypothetical protein
MGVMAWDDVRLSVLGKMPTAGPVLDIIGKYWGDGKLTEEIATEYVVSYAAGDYVAAQKTLYGGMSAGSLIEADQAANAKLKELVDADRRVYDFFGELEGAVLKVALGVAMSALGL